MARILRDKLISHFRRISCGGLVKEAIFKGAFAADVITPDHLLLVLAPDLEGMDVLTEEVGVGDLKKLISALSFIGGEGEEGADVDLSVQDHRLVIDESTRSARVMLVTANPSTIATRCKPETVDRLLEKIEKSVGQVPLAVELLDDVKRTYAGLKAESVQLEVGPNGGFIRVGGGNSDAAEFFSEALQAPEKSTLTFGEHLIKVFEVVSGDIMLNLPAPDSKAIAIDDEDFTFLLSSRAPGSTGKPQVKGSEAAQASVGAGEPAADGPKKIGGRRRKAPSPVGAAEAVE